MSNNTAQWIAQGSWTGASTGAQNSTTVSHLYIGKKPETTAQNTGQNLTRITSEKITLLRCNTITENKIMATTPIATVKPITAL